MVPNCSFQLTLSKNSSPKTSRHFCSSGMSITAGKFGYSFFVAFSNSILGNLFVLDSDASISDAWLGSSALATLGLDALVFTLTFSVLGEVRGCHACGFTRSTLGAFCGGVIDDAASCPRVRLPFCFAAGDVLGGAFAGPFRLGSLPFGVAFHFWGC